MLCLLHKTASNSQRPYPALNLARPWEMMVHPLALCGHCAWVEGPCWEVNGRDSGGPLPSTVQSSTASSYSERMRLEASGLSRRRNCLRSVKEWRSMTEQAWRNAKLYGVSAQDSCVDAREWSLCVH